MTVEIILIIITLLFILAIADLIVGVSNDAVNFLNSAIGSKAAPYKVILIVAICGIIIGSMFSSGIMEIARKGIFHPEFFTFDKILFVFLAVMLTDIILLDIFNTMGLPTSTTVSIVFELLGASLMVGLLMTFDQNAAINEAFKYINFESTRSIISGIFLSIIIAFTSGAIIHYATRYAFTFNYQKRLSKIGPFYAGLGLTTIVYFLLIKGMKGTTILSENAKEWIDLYTWPLMLGILAINTLICFIVYKFAKVNPLKIVVLAGTFSLAMAFAGNDLVNFIGVPITGFLAFENWQASGVAPESLYQTYLAGNDVIVPNYMLLIAGIVMGLTIWLSAKAKKVTETEVNLSRQDEGEERFKPNEMSRNIVRTSMRLGSLLNVLIPEKVRRSYDLSFEKSKLRHATNTQESTAFDLVRASSNLIIASVLIAWATSLKLPLSTTYVTFMVAMGSSLADKAWGRESAVYRVAGVMSVIGGWFITALIAFSVAAIFAFILYKGGTVGLVLLVLTVIFYNIISHVSFSRKEKLSKMKNEKLLLLDENDIDIIQTHKTMTLNIISDVKNNYNSVLEGIQLGDKKILKAANKNLNELEDYSRKLRNKSLKFIRNLKTDQVGLAKTLVYSSDLIHDIIQSNQVLSDESLNYVKNLHKMPTRNFILLLNELEEKMNSLFNSAYVYIENEDIASFEKLIEERNSVRDFINQKLEKQILDIQNEKMGVKQSFFQTNILLQSRDIQAVLMRISKMYKKQQDSIANDSKEI
ncbi:inorganic phosphate transporter [Moheibacter stercoris]|uniref:Phosphate transporter n=1 Tax=Moheibacter stercoris TaxID=1628251 RepID=A0ABV2LTM5_9FLAO